jgi:amino acid transporter
MAERMGVLCWSVTGFVHVDGLWHGCGNVRRSPGKPHIIDKLTQLASLTQCSQNPAREVPKAIVLSVAAAGVTGVLYLIPILFVLPDVQMLRDVANGQPIGLLFKTVTGSSAGGFGLLFLLLGTLSHRSLG